MPASLRCRRLFEFFHLTRQYQDSEAWVRFYQSKVLERILFWVRRFLQEDRWNPNVLKSRKYIYIWITDSVFFFKFSNAPKNGTHRDYGTEWNIQQFVAAYLKVSPPCKPSRRISLKNLQTRVLGHGISKNKYSTRFTTPRTYVYQSNMMLPTRHIKRCLFSAGSDERGKMWTWHELSLQVPNR